MKEKKSLIIEIVIGAFLTGIGCIISHEYYSMMLVAMGFGLICGSVAQLLRLRYWQSPRHTAEYEERKQQEHINRIDERKQYLRARAGQVAYQIMFFMLLILSFVLALVQAEPWIIGMVFVLWILQWVIGVIAFRVLEKRM